MFWKFLLTILISYIGVIFLFPKIIGISTLGLFAYANARKEKNFFVLGIAYYLGLGLWYCLLSFWAAYCALLTHKYTLSEVVIYDWLYWLFALFSAGAPLGFFLLSAQDDDKESYRTLLTGRPTGIEYFTMLSFGIFAFWPDVARQLFGWILFPLINSITP